MADIFRFIHVRPIDTAPDAGVPDERDDGGSANGGKAADKTDTAADLKVGAPARGRLLRHAGGLIRIPPQVAGSTRASSAVSAAASGPQALVAGHQRMAIGDFLAVEESVARYEFGEIAHVENVMAYETRLRRREHTSSRFDESETSSMQSETQQNELSSTERFELSTAATEVLNRSSAINAGVATKGGFGGITFGASFSAASSSSELSVDSQATSFARETVETATQEVTRQVAERRLTRSSVIAREINEHSFTNESARHSVGVYRFLDKVIKARLRNHGQRMMLEFVVPEPAAFLVHALAASSADAIPLEDPGEFNLQLSQIGETDDPANGVFSWSHWATVYNAEGIEPPPPFVQWISTVVRTETPGTPSSDGAHPILHEVGETSVAVPAGYLANHVQLAGQFAGGLVGANGTPSATVWLGMPNFSTWIQSKDDAKHRANDLSIGLSGEIHIAYAIRHQFGASVELALRCVRSNDSFHAWRLDAWKKCRAAHQNRVQQYEARIAQATQSSFSAAYASPASYRATERQELKRAAITMLTGIRFGLYGAMEFPAVGLPRIRIGEANREGANIRLLETAIDWDMMQYRFHPYFWGGRDRWVELIGREAYDPQYQEFLRAGAAHVVVPVNLEFQRAIALLMVNGWKAPLAADWRTTEILPGKHALLDALLTLEAAQRASEPAGEPVVVDEWEVRLPTEIVMLQPGSDPNDPPVGSAPK